MLRELLILAAVACAASLQVEKINSLELSKAAVSNFSPNGEELFITTFGIKADSVSVISDIHAKTLNARTFTKSVFWPNQVTVVSQDEIKSDSEYVLVAGGFFVPGEATGSVDLVRVSDGAATKLTTDKKHFFYHRAFFVDIDGDGNLDILTARADKPMIGAAKGELIWLKRPAGDVFTEQWEEHVLVSGPDVNFIFEDLDNDGKFEVIATEAFSAKRVVVYSCAEKFWSLCENGEGVTSAVIDDTIGIAFSAHRVDINGDGKLDLLVSGQGPPGSVIVYEQPNDFMTETWPKHVLATGYKPLHSMPGQGAPGMIFAFDIRNTTCVIVGGDDAGFVSVLVPKNATNWEFDEVRVCSSSGTIGEVSATKTDSGDALLAVPYYSEGRVELYNLSL